MKVEETVTVDGVKLTRLQVETAIHKLNNKPKQLQPGCYTHETYGRVILVTPWVREVLEKAGYSLEGRLFCVDETGNLLRLEPCDLKTP